MGVSALLVLDGVRDVERLLSEMTIPDSAVRHARPVAALEHAVHWVKPDSFYHPEGAKPDRVIVDLQSNYWWPGMTHRTPGNWSVVSRTCRFIWAVDASIVVHYRPEPDWIGDLTPDELIADADRLTPARVEEFDREADRALEARALIGTGAGASRKPAKRPNRRKRSRDEAR